MGPRQAFGSTDAAARQSAGGTADARPLAGAIGWLISDGKAGHETQARGLAEALGLAAEVIRVAPAGVWRLAAPWGPAPPRDRVGRPGGLMAPPFPAIAIAVGRTTIPYLRALRRRAGLATYTVVLDDPRTGAGVADLVSVPAHDRLRGPNVVTTLCPPHTFSPARLAALRAALPEAIRALPAPRVAVLIGGNNAVHRFDAASEQALVAGLAALARRGASLMITASRRTPAGLMARIAEATAAVPRILYEGHGDNPYAAFLAAADALVVTEDSVNMCGEAAATGRPVYVAGLAGGSAKFRRFHAAMAAHGVTRPLSADPERIGGWHYPPVFEADRIARVIEQRIARRQATLGAQPGEAGAST